MSLILNGNDLAIEDMVQVARSGKTVGLAPEARPKGPTDITETSSQTS